MNHMLKKLSFITAGLVLVTCTVQAQTKEELSKITATYDKQEAVALLEQIKQSEQQQLAAAKLVAAERGLPLSYIDDRGEPVILTGIDAAGELIYTTTHNFLGVRTINAQPLYNNGGMGLNIQGQGINAGIWDGGYVRQTHVALTGRVTYGEPNKAISNHGTHVGGTMISDGTGNVATRGVAFNGTLISFDFDSDTSEMTQQAVAGMLISNHSYGREVDGSTPLSVYGKYDGVASTFDAIANTFDFYLPVVSAGNDRNSGLNPSKNGFDLLTDRSLSKNVMTVGAIENVSNYSGPSSVNMSGFSSFGPPDDGRVKPDIVAKGVGVISTGSANDTAIATLQGTSMSAPMVSGGLMLLQQLYNQQQGSFMRAYTAKGLVLMTTKEAGTSPGPDYRFGWGLMDVGAAAQHILAMNNSTVIDERTLAQGATYTRTVTANGPVLKVGISWNDPAGTVPDNTVDNRQPNLVNDLDIKLTDSNGVDHFPWKLNPLQPGAAASKGVNDVDNIEIVEIQAPTGTYTITVSHKGNLTGGAPIERYALLINGADTGTLSNRQNELQSFVMYPNPAKEFVTIGFNNSLSGDKVVVEIYDILGQLVSATKFENTPNFEQTVNISNLKSGLYLVRVGDGNAFTTKKLVIN